MLENAKRIVAVMVLGVGVAACTDSPTLPQEYLVASLDHIMVDNFGLTAGAGDGSCPGWGAGVPGCNGPGYGTGHGVSVLGELVREAHSLIVAEQGLDAANELFAILRELHAAAFAARQAGDRDTWLELMTESHLEAARLVVEILGEERAQDVLNLAAAKLAELLEDIAAAEAAGENVTRLNNIAQRTAEFLAAAEEASASGDAVVALERASRALQAATVGAQRLGMTHRHQHMRGQQAGDTDRQRRHGN